MPLHDDWSIAALDRRIEAGASPIAIIEGCLERIAALNGSTNALLCVAPEEARHAAQNAEQERRAGRRIGPLHGLPIVVKDMIDVTGWPTTVGSRLYEDRLAQSDSACVARLKAAGAIILGKANLHELVVGGHANPWYGKVVNPLSASHGTGGTSSGSAAAVAARFCVAALGTDTGGSNRSPAAATGLVGFKPTNGLVSDEGVRPAAHSLDAIGPIATTVKDARLLMEVLTGQTAPPDERVPSEIVLATCPDLHPGDVAPEIAAGITYWLDRLRRRGVKMVTLPAIGVEAFISAGLTILSYEIASAYLSDVRAAPERVGTAARAFMESAGAVDALAYAEAQALRRSFAASFLEGMQGVDALLVPTSPGFAPRLSDEMTRVGESWIGFGEAGGRFRRWANMLNMPTLAIPLHCGHAFPGSIQLAARPGEDMRLLRLTEMLLAEPD